MKTIFITGASSGIGKATAKHFAGKGWNVIATMRSPAKETELNELDNVLILRLDVEHKDTIHEAIAKGIERFGRIDVLLNNAGYGTMGIFESATDDQIRRQFDVNVFGLMRMTKAILPHFRVNKSGLIINISSMGGKITFPTMSLYHATKFAVEGFTESLSFELAPQNIHVKLIEPGSISTDFNGRSMEFFFDESLTDYSKFINLVRNGIEKMSELEQFTSPEVVAEVIYQAATDTTNQIRYVVGEDAKNLIKIKEESGDLAFIKHMTQMFS
ncbi:SDR family oxidoreductase [Bacillus cereus]|uniref:SDR family oxidoreductase n=1 Tax=Bacillus TaxID=1386 RepID=UPI0023584BFC|nr:SDR family oxidoreductase [Bacillus cereus]MDA2644463.1 SDR family oxidoreductase [Bacillus cereus]WCT67316.1 SDR family oxidoreductase [Bacillus cereus]HDR4457520.1 SDR family oxidoreductase [Bacillus cereus]